MSLRPKAVVLTPMVSPGKEIRGTGGNRDDVDGDNDGDDDHDIANNTGINETMAWN